MSYASQTNYPDIFKNTYWGNFYDTVKPHLIENRNAFIAEFDIINIKKRPEYISKEYDLIKNTDHNETYYTKNKDYVLISSPYHHVDETPFIENGWTKYLNLYSDDGLTWYKIVPFRSKKLLGNSLTLK